MAYGSIQKTFMDYSGGNNPAAGPYLLAENQCKKSRNVHSTPTGSFRKREGFVNLISNSDLTTRFDSLHSLFAANTASKALIVSGKQAGASNDRIAKIVGTTVTTLKSTLTQGKRWEWVQATASGGQGPIYGVNGTSTPQYWDGTAATTSDWTATTGTVPSSAKYLLYFKDRIWATGTSNQGRVQYSGLSAAAVPGPDPRNWDTDGYVDLEPDDGEDITGIGPVGPYVFVAKPRKCYVITDPASAANRKVSDEVGCIAHRSIVETTRGTFFLSEDVGVCVTDGSKVEQVGEAVLPLIKTAADTNPSLMPYCAGAFFQHSYWLSIPYANAYNDLLLEYDLETQSWWLHDGSISQWGIQDPVGTPLLYVAKSDTAVVQRAFSPGIYQDGGVNYASKAYLESPYYVLGAPHVSKHLNQIRVDGRGVWVLKGADHFTDTYTLIEGVGWETSDATSTSFGVENNFAGAGNFGGTQAGTLEVRYPTPMEGHTRAFSLRYENDDSGDFEIESTTIFATPRSD